MKLSNVFLMVDSIHIRQDFVLFLVELFLMDGEIDLKHYSAFILNTNFILFFKSLSVS